MENLVKNVVNDEELQKMVYQVGGLIGSGIRGGAGIDLGKGGKFKWQDALVQLGAQYFQKVINNPSPSPPSAPSLLSPQSKDILKQTQRDNW